MTGASRKQRRDEFNEEHFDTEDRMDRVLVWLFVIVMAVLGLAAARFIFLK